ncbi:MAG: flagellin [Vampirovibrionia bacterium]
MQALRINTNIDSLFIQRALGIHTRNVDESTKRLATGFRINKPSDDALGYVYSEKLNSQIRGSSAAQGNINDALAAVDTGNDALETVLDNLQRIREIIVEANGGSKTQAVLDAGQIEINNLVTEISDLRTNTEYNGRKLLDGTFNVNVQNGPSNGNTYALDMRTGTWDGLDVNVSAIGSAAGDIGKLGYKATKRLDQMSISINVANNGGGALTAPVAGDLTSLDSMIKNLSTMQASVSAKRNRLSSDYNFLTDSKFNLEKAKSNVMDTDVASESSRLTINQVLQESAVSLLAQANSSPQLALSLIP